VFPISEALCLKLANIIRRDLIKPLRREEITQAVCEVTLPRFSGISGLSKACGPKVKQNGQELFYRCRNHDDHDPSLKINQKKNCWMCGPCGAYGNAWALAAFLARLDPNDKPAVTKWLSEHGLLPNSAGGPRGRHPITVQDLAHDKGLPIDFLTKLGLENCPQGVQITYRLVDNSFAPRQRLRTALAAKKGSFWLKGEGAIVPLRFSERATADRCHLRPQMGVWGSHRQAARRLRDF